VKDYKVILASKSPRRKELLNQIGIEFEILICDKEEIITSNDPEKVVLELSEQKAENVAAMVSGNEKMLIIGADTVVSVDGEIMGKPSDDKHAYEMLKKLSGNTHQVYTGVTVLVWQGEILNEISFAECTDVTMYDISDEEIKEYIKSGEPADKAGSYGIQGLGAKLIKKIDGDYNNVVGLPVARLYREIKRIVE